MLLDKSIYIQNFAKIHPCNQNQLNRYIKYIFLCESKNSKSKTNQYKELHHILPKADDMFPEYIDLNQHEWNGVYLTSKQHIVAHILLKKAFPKSRSSIASVHYYLNVQNSDTISFNRREIPEVIQAIYAAKAKEEYYQSRLGFASYVDPETNEIYFLHSSDPMIKEKNMHGAVKGYKMSDESKQKMRDAKDKSRVATMNFLGFKTTVKLLSDEFSEYLAQGWTVGLSVEDREYNKGLKYGELSSITKNKVDYMYPDGTYYGKLYKDDPIISEIGLVYHLTEGRMQSALKFQKKAVEANTGTSWYNNGTINKKFKEDPGSPWVLGQIGISDEAKKARADALRKAVSGKKCYNDGVKNYYFSDDEVIPDHLTKGMRPRNKK